MLVKSNAHCSVIVEYNGTRYMFNNDGKAIDIPVDALISAYKSGHIHAHELVPVEDEELKRIAGENKLLKEEIAALKNEVEELERKVKKDARKK